MRKSLTYSKMLEDTGIPRHQANKHIEILERVIEDETVTKSDSQLIYGHIASMKTNIKYLTEDVAQLKKDMAEVKQDIKDIRAEMKALEYRMTIKLGLMLVSTAAVSISLLKVIL